MLNTAPSFYSTSFQSTMHFLTYLGNQSFPAEELTQIMQIGHPDNHDFHELFQHTESGKIIMEFYEYSYNPDGDLAIVEFHNKNITLREVLEWAEQDYENLKIDYHENNLSKDNILSMPVKDIGLAQAHVCYEHESRCADRA
jgi:hypothetical protein